MAAGSSSLSLGDELNCPICLEIFIDPVMLDCGHDFCRQCILQCWEREKKAFCPECGEVFRDKNLKANRALGVLSNKIRNLNTKDPVDPSKPFNPFCEEHQEELKLFCETDKKLICVMCLDRRDGRSHKAHNFMLINEAVEIYKIAVYGKNFCVSAKNAFMLLMRNIVRVVVLDKMTDLLLFFGKLLVVGGVGVLAFFFFTARIRIPDPNFQAPILNYYWLPILTLVVGSYMIAHGFFSVYNMCVDTLFLCFLEDLERNDGSPGRPYYMSKSLMKILNKKNKAPKGEAK